VASYRPPSSCAGYSPASPAPRRRGSLPAPSLAGSRRRCRCAVSDCCAPARGSIRATPVTVAQARRPRRHCCQCTRRPLPSPLVSARASSACSAPWWPSAARRSLPTSSCVPAASWEPGSRRWLLERRRIGPVVRALERATDPLFRHAGMSLD